MSHDAFFDQIVDALSKDLDPTLFERCAVDLLRDDGWPVVAVSGGSDSGMDGAVADAQGEPFPLVVTTAKSVIANLKKNLASYVRDGGRQRKALVATSQ